jgi:hypothetical protein
LKGVQFKKAYSDARHEALERIMATVEQHMLEAVSVLRAVMADPETFSPTRVHAAKVISEMGLRCFELHDQEARLQALEADRGIR